MEKLVVFLGVILIPTGEGHNSAVFGGSSPETREHKVVLPEEKLPLNYNGPHKLQLIIDVKDFPQSSSPSSDKVKRRRERVHKRKDKGGKFSHEKNKHEKLSYDPARHTLRNEEKASLVRNKTIEILRNGLRILKASEHPSQTEGTSASRLNETLLEKILFSSAGKHEVLLSASGAYKLPVGAGAYHRKSQQPGNRSVLPFSEDGFDEKQAKRQGGAESKNSTFGQDYEYGFLADFHSNSSNELLKPFEAVNVDQNVGAALEQIVDALRNLTDCSDKSCDWERGPPEDSCQKWLDCGEGLDRAFAGVGDLPSCPCTYPSSIFYEETVWDKKSNKHFRWRDASGEAERLDVYKPGAAYCIRSLLTQGSLSVSSQQCCYDRNLRLLTRGSGAGTINFISPDVSRKLHYTVDILPWRLCKGDFTRYNKARNPNNGNNCSENPSEEEFQLQVKLSKIY